jgi:hypothetical protein
MPASSRLSRRFGLLKGSSSLRRCLRIFTACRLFALKVELGIAIGEKLKVEVKLGGNSLSDADLKGTN